MAEGGRILGVDNKPGSSELCGGFSPALGSFKPELGGLSPELGGLSLELGIGLSTGVSTFLSDVSEEKGVGPVVFRLLATGFLKEGEFLMFWIDELRESLDLIDPASGLMGLLGMALVGVLAERSLDFGRPSWLDLDIAEPFS